MSGVDVKLSDSNEDAAVFHDLRYTNDRQGGNHTNTMFEINNIGGNEIFVEVSILEQDPKTKKWEHKWYDAFNGQGADGVRIHLRGSAENSEFLAMLQLILEAEKMVGIIKP